MANLVLRHYSYFDVVIDTKQYNGLPLRPSSPLSFHSLVPLQTLRNFLEFTAVSHFFTKV